MNMRARIKIMLIATLAAAGCAGPGELRSADYAASPGERMALARSMHFPTASHRAERKEWKALAGNATWISQNPEAVIILEGHCDERGSEEYNVELGDRRARWVMGELMARGVDVARLIVLSKGEDEPVDSDHTIKAWRVNRRVEFIPR